MRLPWHGAAYDVGDVVVQRQGSQTRFVLVRTKEEDIKNGRPGFDGVETDAQGNVVQDDPEFSGVWGYDDQVIRIVKHAK